MEKIKTKVINIKSGEPYDIYIGRAGHGLDGFWGNLHTMGGIYCPECKSHHDRAGAIAAFKKDFYDRIGKDEIFKNKVLELKGKILGCFCKPLACHGDIIKDYLDKLDE